MGVAWETASTALCTSSKPEAARAPAKEIMTKARPTMAGLNTFFPKPPKAILPNRIPTTAPIAAIQ